MKIYQLSLALASGQVEKQAALAKYRMKFFLLALA
jgi:hypothetical protein